MPAVTATDSGKPGGDGNDDDEEEHHHIRFGGGGDGGGSKDDNVVVALGIACQAWFLIHVPYNILITRKVFPLNSLLLPPTLPASRYLFLSHIHIYMYSIWKVYRPCCLLSSSSFDACIFSFKRDFLKTAPNHFQKPIIHKPFICGAFTKWVGNKFALTGMTI